MPPVNTAALPRFLGGTPRPATPTANAQYRLLASHAAPVSNRPAAVPTLPAVPAVPQVTQQPTNLRPVLNAQGQVVAYVMAPAEPTAPAKPAKKNAQLGNAVLGVATTGLGVAGVAFPPALPIAGITGVVTAIDSQIGSPIATAVGATINGVGDAGKWVVDGVGDLVDGIGDGINSVGKGIGDLFDGIFGRKK